MVKLLVCDKVGSLGVIVEDIKKRFSNIVVDFTSDCQVGPFLGLSDSVSTEPRIIFYGNIKFDALLESIEIFEKGSFHVSDRVVDFIDMIDKDVNIKVFVTVSCGWCFPAILKAVSFAYLCPKIRVEIFDCYSFPQYATKYNVVSVPKTVINNKVEFVGTKDDNEFFGYIMKSIED